MKKYLAIFLLAFLVVGVLVGCSDDNATEVSDLANARAYVFNMYKGNVGKDEAQVLTKDFEVVTSVPVAGVSYSVSWSVNVTAGNENDVQIVDGTNGAKKIDSNEKPEEQLDFTLTATVSDAEGNTETTSFKYTVKAVEKPQGEEQTAVYTETDADGDKLIIFYPTEALAMSATTSGNKLATAYATVNGNDMTAISAAVFVVTVDGDGNYTFTCGGKYLTAGETGNSRTLADSASPYSLWVIEAAEGGVYLKNANAAYNDNAQYLEYYSGFTTYGFNETNPAIYTFQFFKTEAESKLPEKVDAPSDPKEIVDAAFALADGAALPYSCTLTGPIVSIKTPYDAGYKNVSVIISVEGSDGTKELLCYRLKGDGADTIAVGDTITVTGTIKNFTGTIEFDQGCTLDKVVKGEGGDVSQPETSAPETSTPETSTPETSVPETSVPETSAPETSVPETSTPEVSQPETSTPDVSEPDTSTPETPATGDKAIVDAAFALESGKTLDGTHTLTGKIVSIKTPYDSGYKNISVVINVEGSDGMKELLCYRLKGDGADKLAVGDTITVTGSITNYNGTIEYAQGCTLDKVVSGGGTVPVAPSNPKEIVDAAFALDKGASLPYLATLTGKVTKITEAYSDTYKNITFIISVESSTGAKEITCYRLKGEGANSVKVGDTVTVKGTLMNYNGTIEFGSGCTLD